MQGIRQGADAGVVMEKRAQAAQTVLYPIFDNARRSRKLLGKIVLAYMQKHIKPGRRIRVLGQSARPEVVQVDEAMLQGKFDLYVDESESTINDRVATLHVMQTTLPQIMKAGVPVPPSFVDLLPMDPEIREEWKNMIAWQLAQSGALPPPGWKAGDPIPMPGMPAAPGALPPGAPPPVSPQARRTTVESEALKATEAECAEGRTAPRVSLADIEAKIAEEHYVVGAQAVNAAGGFSAYASLDTLTLCMLVMDNGFVLIGKSAPASVDNFDPMLGRKLAYEDAIRQVWPLMGFALRERLNG